MAYQRPDQRRGLAQAGGQRAQVGARRLCPGLGEQRLDLAVLVVRQPAPELTGQLAGVLGQDVAGLAQRLPQAADGRRVRQARTVGDQGVGVGGAEFGLQPGEVEEQAPRFLRRPASIRW